MPRSKGSRKNRPLGPTTRTQAISWIAISIAVIWSLALMLSTLWESYMPPWISAAFDQKPKLLALTAATFAILAILTPVQNLPKQHLVVVVAGGLTGYAAVINTFDVSNLSVAGAVIISTIPIFIYLTNIWRLPRGWEWATWSAAISFIAILATMATANTNAGLLFAGIFGEDDTFAIMGAIIGISVIVLFIALSALVVKAVGMASAQDTSAYIKNQALGRKR